MAAYERDLINLKIHPYYLLDCNFNVFWLNKKKECYQTEFNCNHDPGVNKIIYFNTLNTTFCGMYDT